MMVKMKAFAFVGSPDTLDLIGALAVGCGAQAITFCYAVFRSYFF
jgi:hypothetical protein